MSNKNWWFCDKTRWPLGTSHRSRLDFLPLLCHILLAKAVSSLEVEVAVVESDVCGHMQGIYTRVYFCLTYMVRNEVYKYGQVLTISGRWALTGLANKYCQSQSIQRLARKEKFYSSFLFSSFPSPHSLR